MYYEINIAKKVNGSYQHFFATTERSITDKVKAIQVLKEITDKFKSPEYNISISYYSGNGSYCDAESFIKNPDILK